MVYELFNLAINITDTFFAYLLFFTNGLMRAFAISLFVITLAKILSTFHSVWVKTVLRYLLLGCYLLYILIGYGLLIDFNNISLLEGTALIFGIVMPICLLIVGDQIKRWNFRGHKYFSLWILWVAFVIITFFWEIVFPDDISFGFCVLYALISFCIYVYFSRKNSRKGGRPDL